MYMALVALNAIVGIGILVCYIMVVIKMFQAGDTGWGIASLVTLLCCGIGVLVALIGGWINQAKWGVDKNLLLAYTGLVVLNIFLGIGVQVTAPATPVMIGTTFRR